MLSPWHIGLMLLLFFLSGFFSASEMAYSSANQLRLQNSMEAGSKRARLACYITEHFDDALSTILIGNNLVNIAASSAATVIAITVASEDYAGLATAIVAVIIIIFGETMPKIVAKKNATRAAIAFSYPVRALMTALKPVVRLVVWLTGLITKPLRGEGEASDQELVNELQSIIETVEDEGVIDSERSELLQAALDFSETSAREVMTSRVDMEAIDIEDSWEEIMAVVDNSPYSRLPVYEDTADNIIGILYLNHLFKAMIECPQADIRSLLMEPCYVYKTQKLPDVLTVLRRHKMHMAVVTDDYGGTMGVITMEDVLEELVGEIWDETDVIEDEFIKLAENLYEVDGGMRISDLLEELEIDEDDFEAESGTVGGWTLECFKDYPEEGDSFTLDGLTVRVLKMDGQRVERVELRVEEADEESQD